MSSIPLYDELLLSSASIGLDAEGLQKISATIGNMRKDHAEIIYALIVYYYWLTYGDLTGVTTKAVDKGKGVLIEMESLPAPLQQILAAYVFRVAKT